MKELEELAETVRTQLDLQYDADSVKFIEGFIERQRERFDEDNRTGLVNALGSFLGQCIIKNYGGQWQLDEEYSAPAVVFDNVNKAYPFAKVRKQFDNGLGDSIYSFYNVILVVFQRKEN